MKTRKLIVRQAVISAAILAVFFAVHLATRSGVFASAVASAVAIVAALVAALAAALIREGGVTGLDRKRVVLLCVAQFVVTLTPMLVVILH